ncbi:MAG: hypothetical protein ABJH52_04355 [Henriciella sp.]
MRNFIALAALAAVGCSAEVSTTTKATPVETDSVAPSADATKAASRFDVPSDADHTYYLRGMTRAANWKYFVDVESHGPGGTLFTRRVIDCNADIYGNPWNTRESILIAEATTLAEFNTKLDTFETSTKPIIQGSITDYVARHACSKVDRP